MNQVHLRDVLVGLAGLGAWFVLVLVAWILLGPTAGVSAGALLGVIAAIVTGRFGGGEALLGTGRETAAPLTYATENPDELRSEIKGQRIWSPTGDRSEPAQPPRPATSGATAPNGPSTRPERVSSDPPSPPSSPPPGPVAPPPEWKRIERTSVASSFSEMAALLDATLPSAQDPYRAAKDVVDRQLRSIGDPEALELFWGFWIDAPRVDAAVAQLRRRRKRPDDPTVSALLAGMEKDPDRADLARRLAAYTGAYGLPADARERPAAARFPVAFATLLELAEGFYAHRGDAYATESERRLLLALADVAGRLTEGTHSPTLVAALRRDLVLSVYTLYLAEPRVPHGREEAPRDERWETALDELAALNSWPQPPARTYSRLAHLGERILRSIRSVDWGTEGSVEKAADWALFWREDIELYSLAFHVVGWPDWRWARGIGDPWDGAGGP